MISAYVYSIEKRINAIKNVLSPGTSSELWVNGRYFQQEDAVLFLDKSHIPASYWYRGEPNENGCVRRVASGVLRDRPCNSTTYMFGFICERVLPY